jgi:N-acetylglucosaminyldiphosphoundecaprenol N-acetyl-beta-D-mannosaminyltransferase
MASQRFQILGIEVERLTLDQLNAIVTDAIDRQERMLLANHNLHSVYLCHVDAKMRAFYDEASHIHIDGMPIVLLGRLRGLPFRAEHRVTYADWIHALAEQAAENNWRVFYLGSRPGVADRGAEILRQQYPGLEIRTTHGYFDASPGSEEDRLVMAAIKEYRPHLLILGMGMPRQEHWLFDHLDQLPETAILNAGAAIDYVAGAVRTPPRWAGRFGLEWLFRLAAEPDRLWRRYLVEPWYILGLFLRDLV